MNIDKLFYMENKRRDGANIKAKVVYQNFTPTSFKKVMFDFKRIEFNHSPYMSGVLNDFVFDVTTAMDNAFMTEVQTKRLQMYMYGYTEKEIAEQEGVSRWVVSKSINVACAKLFEEINTMYKYDM